MRPSYRMYAACNSGTKQRAQTDNSHVYHTSGHVSHAQNASKRMDASFLANVQFIPDA